MNEHEEPKNQNVTTTANPPPAPNPFGEVSCEEEVELFGDRYKEYFFQESPFNSRALDPKVYLIIGRRGSGKSSLAHYFGFQKTIERAVLIDVDEPAFYEDALLKISKVCEAETNPDLSVQRMVHVWTLGIWSLLFHTFFDDSDVIATASLALGRAGSTSLRQVLGRCFEVLLGKLDATGELARHLEASLQSGAVQRGQAAVLEIAKTRPVFVAIDTIERYRANDEPLMVATSALIQASFAFNRKYAKQGVHIKTFIPSEVFPSISDKYSINTLKYIQDEVYLHWRPRALVRLVCWRLSRFMESHDRSRPSGLRSVRWEAFDSVLHDVWESHFDSHVANRVNVLEPSFVYVLRHTQMRPRQLVVLCNQIARLARRRGTFPKFSSDLICRAIWDTENKLAKEVISSYEGTYPNVSEIVAALKGVAARFKGNLLDKVAHSTASSWPQGHYSQAAFRQLVGELGIIGRVRRESNGIIEADFEYALDNRISLNARDDCVVHPMFYRDLSINTQQLNARVLPFPDHPDFEEVRNGG
jgi:hypothetical protein